MRKIFLTITCLVCAAASLPAQTSIRDQFASKAEACADAAYRQTPGYKSYGQIGWERETGWRDIQYLDRYESEHRRYSTNAFLYCQVARYGEVVDDCEIVALNSEGYVVGNQCPEPSPLGAGEMKNVAMMAIFGDTPGEEIHFVALTGYGSREGDVVETKIVETLKFQPNSTTGLVDADGDGRLDTWQPMTLNLDLPSSVAVVEADAAKMPLRYYNLSGQQVDYNSAAVGTILVCRGKKIVR